MQLPVLYGIYWFSWKFFFILFGYISPFANNNLVCSSFHCVGVQCDTVFSKVFILIILLPCDN